MSKERRQAKTRPRLGPAVWEWVKRLLREDWSPEQISLWLAREKKLSVSHEWIYRYVLKDKHYGGDLHRYLRS